MLTKFESFFRNEDVGKLLLRLAIGGLMLPHGVAKLMHGLDPIKEILSSNHLPQFIAYGVPIGELVAPLLLVVGFWSRFAGAIFVINMLMTFFLVFGFSAFSLNEHGGLTGELNLLFLFGALAIVFLGSGKYSISQGIGRWD